MKDLITAAQRLAGLIEQDEVTTEPTMKKIIGNLAGMLVVCALLYQVLIEVTDLLPVV